MSIFEERGIASDDMLFVAFQYYQSVSWWVVSISYRRVGMFLIRCYCIVQGCVTEDPVTSLYQYNDDLQSGVSLATSMLNTLNGIGVDNINRLCGGDVSSIVVGMELINDNLSALLDALRQVVLHRSFLLVCVRYEFKLTLLIVHFLSWQVAQSWVHYIRRCWRAQSAPILLKARRCCFSSCSQSVSSVWYWSCYEPQCILSERLWTFLINSLLLTGVIRMVRQRKRVLTMPPSNLTISLSPLPSTYEPTKKYPINISRHIRIKISSHWFIQNIHELSSLSQIQ